jgi:hypothetical protein
MNRFGYFLTGVMLLVSISVYGSYYINKKLQETKHILKKTKHFAYDYDRFSKMWTETNTESKINKILNLPLFKNIEITKNSTNRDIEMLIDSDDIKSIDLLINKILNENFKIDKINISNNSSRVVIKK